MKLYKEIRTCYVCKTRFVVDQERGHYCGSCVEKYNKRNQTV